MLAAEMVNAANKIKMHQFCLVSISNLGAQSELGRVLAGTKKHVYIPCDKMSHGFC